MENFFYKIEKMNIDGFSFVIIPSIVFSKTKHNNNVVSYSLVIGFLIWLIKIEKIWNN